MRSSAPILPARLIWLAIFMFTCLWGRAAAAPPIPATSDEVYHYREVTGGAVKKVKWHLSKRGGFTLTYTSPIERHVTTTDPGYDTRRWQVTSQNRETELTAERLGQTIMVHGRTNGQAVDKVLQIDDRPWYQATSLSMRDLIASNDTERTFWTIRFDTLTAHKIKAIKKGVQKLESTDNVLHIRLTLPGLLAPFWKSDYWFALPDWVFLRFRGPSGPPGSPMTTVTRLSAG